MKMSASEGLRAVLVKKLPFFTLNISIACPPGRTVVLTGPSGSGKTTILRCLAGLERIDGGQVHFNGRSWNDAATGLQIRPQDRGVGFLNQSFALFPHMTLARNIRFAMQRSADPSDLMDTMGIGHLRDKRPHEISGGERQRAALCQTLARCPKLLLLDEPFSALDMENRHLLKHYLRRFQLRYELPIILVTHDLVEALTSSEHVIALRQGKTDDDWLQRQKRLFRAGLNEQTDLGREYMAA